MQGKIALEEHIMAPDFAVTGDPAFVNEAYHQDTEHKLVEYKERLQEMDQTGIQTAILSLTATGIEGVFDAGEAVERAQQMNDYMANFFIANNPSRFLGFAALPMQNPKAAAKELERCIKTLGFKGALINGYSNIGNADTAQYLDEPQVWEFWDCVEALNVPVYLHPRMPLASQQRIYQGYDALLGSAYGFGAETAVHAMRLMLSGLFDRFPKLNVILGHLGEALPYTLPRTQHRLRHQKPEFQGKHKRPLMDYLRENFYLTTSGIMCTQTLNNALSEVGSDRIMFSVDHPYESMTELSTWFDTCSISENDRLKIGKTNAQKLFNIA